MNKNLCNVCVRANNDCPIWEPGSYCSECVEFKQDTSLQQVSVPLFEPNDSLNNFLRHDEEGFERTYQTLMYLFGIVILCFVLAKLFN